MTTALGAPWPIRESLILARGARQVVFGPRDGGVILLDDKKSGRRYAGRQRLAGTAGGLALRAISSRASCPSS